MALPSSADARVYYRCALQRFDDAGVRLRAEHTTGAVYLAGYAIECMLKALVIMAVPRHARRGMLKLFRRGEAHQFEWLWSQYLKHGGARFPREIRQHFTLVNDWSTDLRYVPGTVRPKDAEAFMKSTEAIIQWADARL
jgi:hypothetical protein